MADQTVRTSSSFTRNGFLATTAVGTAAMLLVWGAGTASAAVGAVPLGTAESFVILAGTGVAATGANTLSGDLGVHPGSSLTGGATITSTGSQYIADAVALQAQSDLTTAYLNAAGQGPATVISAAELGGKTLTSGVHTSAAALNLTGVLELDAEGDEDALFVIQASSNLTVDSGASVELINGATWCNVFWQVGSSASIGSGASFAGSILALTSITLADGATVEGRALARNGNVTLINNTFTTPDCTPGSVGADVTPVGGVDTGNGSAAAAPTGVDATLAVAGSVGVLAAAAAIFAVLTRRRLSTV